MIRLLLFLVCFGSAAAARAQGMEDTLRRGYTAAALSMLPPPGELNIADRAGATPLSNACRWGNNPFTVAFLLAQGAAVDSPRSPGGRTPLMVGCAYFAGEAVVGELLRHGADPNARALDGSTPLILAARNFKAEVVKILLENGADPALKDNSGKTALDYARDTPLEDWMRAGKFEFLLHQGATIALLEETAPR